MVLTASDTSPRDGRSSGRGRPAPIHRGITSGQNCDEPRSRWGGHASVQATQGGPGRGRSPAATGQFIDRTPGGVTSVMSHDHRGATNAIPASRSRTGHGQTHSLSSKAIQRYFGALEPLTVLWRRRNIVGAKTLIRVSRVVGGPPHGEACGPRPRPFSARCSSSTAGSSKTPHRL